MVASTLPKTLRANSTSLIKTALPCLLLQIHPERARITFFVWEGFSGSNFYNTLVIAPFIQTLVLDKRRCILSEVIPDRALLINDILILFKIVTICSTSALFQTLGLKLRLFFIKIWWPFLDVPKWRWLMGEGLVIVPLYSQNWCRGKTVKKMYSFGSQPRGSFIHEWYFNTFQNCYDMFNRGSFPNSGFDDLTLFYHQNIFLFGGRSQIFPNEGDWWVRDRLLISFTGKKGHYFVSKFFYGNRSLIFPKLMQGKDC